MTARIITTKEIETARKVRVRHRAGQDRRAENAQLPPVTPTLVDMLFDAEWDHRLEKAPRRRAA